MVLLMLALALGALPPAAWSADDLMASQWVEQAREWQRKDRDDLAAEIWRKLLRAEPKHPEALVKLGLIEARAGNFRLAKELYARAGRLPKPPAGLRQLSAVISPTEVDVEKSAIPLPTSRVASSKPDPIKGVAAKGNPVSARTQEQKVPTPLVSSLPKKDAHQRPAERAEVDTLHLKFSDILEISP